MTIASRDNGWYTSNTLVIKGLFAVPCKLLQPQRGERLATSTLTLPDFIARWKDATLTERSAAQSHFIQLCQVLGFPSPAEVDMQGTSYTFEKGTAKTAGGKGY